MSCLGYCRAALTSKPARAFYWLLLAIAFCVFIVLLLDLLEVSDNQFHSSTRLEFFPKPQKRSMIHFSYKRADSVSRWTERIDKSLDSYKQEQPHVVTCGFDKLPTANETCKVDINAMEPCVHLNDYGFSKGSPCIFLKFKKTLDWTPEYLDYDDLAVAGLSRGFVADIREKIAKDDPKKLKAIWVSCGGKTLIDREIIGSISYMPWKGFPGYFFPYKGQSNYLEPIVAIKFLNPRTNVVIDVDCKVVARNFNETVSFRLLVDED